MSVRLNRLSARIFFRFTIVIGLLILLGVCIVLAKSRAELQRKPDFSNTAYVGATACANCHLDRHQSWAKTFHSTMTQPVSAKTIQGQFDGRLLSHDALRIRLPWLLEAMQDDRPGVRRFAWRSAIAIDDKLQLGMADALKQFDYIGTASARMAVIERLQQEFLAIDKTKWAMPTMASGLSSSYQLLPELRAQLLALGAVDEKQIDIGE